MATTHRKIGAARMVLVLVLILSLQPLGATRATGTPLKTSSSAQSGDSDGCVAEMSWSYDNRQLGARFAIDLPNCWRWKKSYRVKAWIERSEASDTNPRRVSTKRSCNPERACRVRVRMAHPSPELASYRLSIEYMPTRSGVLITHRILTCANAPGILTRCEQP